MSSMSSRIQILTIEKTDGTGKDGTKFERVAARCILLGDDGKVVTVGRLRVPKALQGVVTEGLFRAGFALKVPDYGDNKGDIVAELTSLQAEPRKGMPQPA